MALIIGAGVVIAGGSTLLLSQHDQGGMVTLLYLTNDVVSARSQGVFELQNDADFYLPELGGWIEQNSGRGWTMLSGLSIEDKIGSGWPPGKTVFRSWVPSTGGPYRVVLHCGPRQRNSFLNFVSRHEKFLPGPVASRLLERPKIISKPFRVTKGKPLKREDLPVIYVREPDPL